MYAFASIFKLNKLAFIDKQNWTGLLCKPRNCAIISYFMIVRNNRRYWHFVQFDQKFNRSAIISSLLCKNLQLLSSESFVMRIGITMVNHFRFHFIEEDCHYIIKYLHVIILLTGNYQTSNATVLFQLDCILIFTTRHRLF